jgi:hypothetical protein
MRYNPAMRRLPRILLNVITALSLILFAATVALWVRSYLRHDMIGYRGEWISARIESAPGSFAFIVVSASEPWPVDESGWY